MKYALFLGCTMPHHLKSYESSTKALLEKVDIETRLLPFTCCGYSVKDMDAGAAVYMAAWNMALAQHHGLSIMTPCKCCFGSLKSAAHRLRQDSGLLERVNEMLAKEDMALEGDLEVKHLLTVLNDDVGLSALKRMRKNVLSGLVVASSYGCHALRPSAVTGFDNPHMPTIFEDLVAVTGAQCAHWEERLQCCGHPVKKRNSQLAHRLVQKKMTGAKNAGANIISSACTYCQLQYDRENSENPAPEKAIPSVLYPQLLGLSLDIAPELLGFEKDGVLGQLACHL